MEETLEQVQARHRKEKKELQGRITNKKKNATKKTRKGVNDECADLERELEARHREELAQLSGDAPVPSEADESDEGDENENDAAETQLAAKLEGTAISKPDAPIAASTPTEGAPGAGKKRNRHKDRLARRAAEQEATKAAAEAEAANMVDHRGAEKTQMRKTFAAHGLTEHEIAPDGHCLFSAVADQLAAQEVPIQAMTPRGDGETPRVEPFRAVRHAAAGYMESHPDDYAGFLEEPLGGYVAKIRDTAEWGGQLELSALANTYGVEINVVQDGRTEQIRPNGTDKGGEKPLKSIWLAYYRHGYGLGEHYNSLRKAP